MLKQLAAMPLLQRQTMAQGSVRVVSVPSRHPYIDQIHGSSVISIDESGDGVHQDGVPTGDWAPPKVFEPSWIDEHEDDFDLYHVHFGIEGYSVEHLRAVIAALKRTRKPLVYTVHDLINPQLMDQTHHQRQLDVLILAADGLITLTERAARRVHERWRRPVAAIAHPLIVPLDFAPAVPPAGPEITVSIHFKDLRPNIDSLGTLRRLAGALAILEGCGPVVRAHIYLQSTVRDDAVRDQIRLMCAAANYLTLHEYPRLSDTELYTELNAADVALLPYAYGTHSGWVEMCWDLGVPVVGPNVGFYADQHPDADFYHQFERDEGPKSMAKAIMRAIAAGRHRPRPTVQAERRAEREKQLQVVADQHLAVYRKTLGSTASSPAPRVFPRPTITTSRPLRIVVIAPLRYPIAQPHAGGLESSIWNHIRQLKKLGHRVTLCATEGSDYLVDGPLALKLPGIHWPDPSLATDITYPPGYLDRAFAAMGSALQWISEHSNQFDIVENHCLHGLPLEWTGRIALPMVTNLHTPALPDLVDAHRIGGAPHSQFVAVSTHTATAWIESGIESTVVPNAVDPDLWPLGDGGPDVVWFGRIVPEKAPHLAVLAAAAAGLNIVIAGRVGDADYAAKHLWPLLGATARYAGALRQPELADLVGRSACALITPLWDEPFGLVIAESLMTGTAVATFEVGGIPEVVAGMPGTLAVPRADVDALASAVTVLARQSRRPGARLATREAAVQRFSIESRVHTLVDMYSLEIERFRSMASSA